MIRDTVPAVKTKLHGKVFAYNRVFDRESPYAETVLKDLAKFCRAHESTFHPDPRIHAALEGRREVWLRIQECLELSLSEIYELHKIHEFKVEGEVK